MNLVKISEIVKRAIIAAAALLFLYIAGLIISPAIKSAYKMLFPPKDLPNPIYGKLDPLEFTVKSITNTNPPYTLNTRDGRLPGDFPNKIFVYSYINQPFLYTGTIDAQRHAEILGYTFDDMVSDLKGTVYKWAESDLGGYLAINTQNRSLKLYTSLANKGQYFPAGKLDKGSAINYAKELLTRLSRFSDPLYQKGTQDVYLGTFEGARVAKADTKDTVQIARVDFFRSIDKYPILGPDPKEGLLHVLVGSPQNSELKLNYPIVETNTWQLETQSSATYPIIPISLAWQKVQENGGAIVNVTPKNQSPFEPYTPTRVEKILINDIYLAYFDDKAPQKYLQPIYVFEGNYINANGDSGNITVYYPAVSGDYINQPEPPPQE